MPRLIISESIKIELDGSEYLLEPGDAITINEAVPGLEPQPGLKGDDRKPREDQGLDSIEGGVSLAGPNLSNDPKKFQKEVRKLARAKRMKEFFPVVNTIDKNEFDELAEIVSDDETRRQLGLSAEQIISFLQHIRNSDNDDIRTATSPSLGLKSTLQLYSSLYPTKKVPTISMVTDNRQIDFSSFKDFLKHKPQGQRLELNDEDESQDIGNFLIRDGSDFKRTKKGDTYGDPIRYTFNGVIRYINRYMKKLIKHTDIAYRQFLRKIADDMGVEPGVVAKIDTYLRNLIGKRGDAWARKFARFRSYLDKPVLGGAVNEAWLPSGRTETSMVGGEPVETEYKYSEEDIPTDDIAWQEPERSSRRGEAEGLQEIPLSRTTADEQEKLGKRIESEDESDVAYEEELAKRTEAELTKRIGEFSREHGSPPSEDQIELMKWEIEDDEDMNKMRSEIETDIGDSEPETNDIETTFSDRDLETDPILHREFQNLVASALA